MVGEDRKESGGRGRGGVLPQPYAGGQVREGEGGI